MAVHRMKPRFREWGLGHCEWENGTVAVCWRNTGSKAAQPVSEAPDFDCSEFVRILGGSSQALTKFVRRSMIQVCTSR